VKAWTSHGLDFDMEWMIRKLPKRDHLPAFIRTYSQPVDLRRRATLPVLSGSGTLLLDKMLR
jgi:hypothetical protein